MITASKLRLVFKISIFEGLSLQKSYKFDFKKLCESCPRCSTGQYFCKKNPVGTPEISPQATTLKLHKLKKATLIK